MFNAEKSDCKTFGIDFICFKEAMCVIVYVSILFLPENMQQKLGTQVGLLMG